MKPPTEALALPAVNQIDRAEDLLGELEAFDAFGKATVVDELQGVPVFINEFWTSRQRAAHSLHEISYRACFKPQLPRFFIERLTKEGDTVYDPFAGRGTTVIEAALLGRRPIGCDINPLSRMLCEPRLRPPALSEIAARLQGIDFNRPSEKDFQSLLVFYHPDTLIEICALRRYFLQRAASGKLDSVDAWIRMVATNRLTGHSAGFFSVYTLPPNQAVSLQSQQRINAKRGQVPPRRHVPDLILRKSRTLLADLTTEHVTDLLAQAVEARFLTCNCAQTSMLESDSVELIVTSPPFLDTVDYAQDNWLRGWFCGIDLQSLPIWRYRKQTDWAAAMHEVFGELQRVLRSGSHLAFEVGEIRDGQVKLEESVLEIGRQTGLIPVCVLINDQAFTKTANCWGVSNRLKGTNTNRIVVFRK